MHKLFALVLLLLAEACSQPGSKGAPEASVPGQLEATDQQEAPLIPEPARPPAPANRQLIRTAQVRIRVADFRASGRAIGQAVRRVGGQTTGSNETKTDNSIETALTIRVPAARFDTLLAMVLKESIFDEVKTITVDDITRRYVDVEARIRSKKAVEETYLNLLKKARTVEEILKIEEQLGNIREEREVQEAELRQLKDEVAMSTLNLTYYQQTENARQPQEPFFAQIWRNFTDGFGLLSSVFVGLFYLLPLGLFGGAVIWLILRWRRSRRG